MPNGHTFHDDITWLADSDVTRACNPPANDQFCPGDDVTREQMAAFLHRLATNQVVDAGTLDGLDSTEFQPSGCVRGAVMAFGLVDESMLTDVNMGTAGVTEDFTCTGTDVTAADGATGIVEIHIGDSAVSGPTGEFICPPQIAHITLGHETGPGAATVQTVLVNTGAPPPSAAWWSAPTTAPETSRTATSTSPWSSSPECARLDL